MAELKNVRGGGLHYMTDYSSPESKLFKAGLKHHQKRISTMVVGKLNSVEDLHDKINYERGFIIHSRSPHNQLVNFHFMYGGFKKFFIERRLMNHVYRKLLRKFWIPVTFGYTIGCIGMRRYDNAAYNFFYFSD